MFTIPTRPPRPGYVRPGAPVHRPPHDTPPRLTVRWVTHDRQRRSALTLIKMYGNIDVVNEGFGRTAEPH